MCEINLQQDASLFCILFDIGKQNNEKLLLR